MNEHPGVPPEPVPLGVIRNQIPTDMRGFMISNIDTWENEGGAGFYPAALLVALCGTPSQVEWAERIRRQVDNEFHRVAGTLASVATKQGAEKSAATQAILRILEEKRAEVLSIDRAGYFIHAWQECGNRISQMLGEDLRFQTIRASRSSQHDKD